MKVIVQQLVFPHYRRTIFGKLIDALGSKNTTFIGGEKNRESGLASISEIASTSGALAPVTFVRNYFIGRWASWQSGFLKHVLLADFDVLILQGDVTILSNWFAQILALLRGKRVLLWTHGFYGNERGAKKFLRLLNLRLSSGLLLYGNYARLLLEKEGFADERLYVVYNSEDTYEASRPNQAAMDPAQLFKRKVNQVIIFVGRLTVVKKLDMLIRAHAQVLEEYPEVGLLFVGDGPERESLQILAEELGTVDATHFYGPTYEREVLQSLLKGAALCVSPGNVGLTAMTAMSQGVPVLTHGDASSQMPEFEAIIPGKTGAFFEPNSISDLALKIKFWLERQSEPNEVSLECRKMIDAYYNPNSQIKVIIGAMYGEAADHFPRRAPTIP